MEIKEQVKELIMNNFSPNCLDTDCNNFLDPIPEVCAQCTSKQIHSLYEQAGYLPIQADSEGLAIKKPCNTCDYRYIDNYGIGCEHTCVQYKEYSIALKSCKAQKAIDDKEKEDKDEKYNKLADDNFGKVTGDLFRELANPIFRYEFLKETQQINGEILSSKLAIAKKEKEEAVKKVFDWFDENIYGCEEDYNHVCCINNADYEAFKKQTLEELEEKK